MKISWFKSLLIPNHAISNRQEDVPMSPTNSKRQKKHREQMKERGYVLIRMWVPKEKAKEIKSLVEELTQEREYKKR